MQSNSEQTISLPVYTSRGLASLELPMSTLQLPIRQIPQLISNRLGFSNRIYFYHYPLHCFGKMNDLQEGTFEQLITKCPDICITYNNTQFEEERVLGYESQVQLVSNHKITVIIQSMTEDGIFYHEQYALPLESPCSSLINLAGRHRKEFSLNFHELRLPLSHFIEEMPIKDAIPWIQEVGYLLVCQGVGQNIKKQTLKVKDENWWKIVGYNESVGIVHKQRNWRIVSWMLKQIMYNGEAYCQKAKSFLPIQEIKEPNLSFSDKIVLRSPATSTYSLPNPLKNTIFLGIYKNYLYFISESAIVSIFSSSHPFQQISTHHLLSLPTENYDEDLVFIAPPYLMAYSVTINFIKVKYYDLKTMNFMFLRNWEWKKDLYGEIIFSVIDLFAVRHKKSYFLQVFSIETPKDSLIIDNYTDSSTFHPSRAGLNPFSDKSGIFAIHNSNLNRTRIFSLKMKIQLFQIDHMRYQVVKEVIFSQGKIQKYLTFCLENAYLLEYRFSTDKENKYELLNHLKDCNASLNETYMYGFDEMILIALRKKSYRIVGDKKINKLSEGTVAIQKNKAMALINFMSDKSSIKNIFVW